MKTQTSKEVLHTQGEWKIGETINGEPLIYVKPESEGYTNYIAKLCVLELNRGSAKANAELIVKAVNEYEGLMRWKKEALAVMPDSQKLGDLMKVPLGQSVNDKIIPFMQKLLDSNRELLDAVRHLMFQDLMFNALGWLTQEQLKKAYNNAKKIDK